MSQIPTPDPPSLRGQYQHVLVHRSGHLLEITINRPQARNSLDWAANDELGQIFDAYFGTDELWVAILAGAGREAFCAGADLVRSGADKPMWQAANGFGGLTRRRSLPKPVIAAVNGYAFGGGCELALACHLVVADTAACFALSEVRVGLVAGTGVVRLPRAIPPKIATEMILTGRRMGAAEALSHGLINRVVDAGAAVEGARALAAEILDAAPAAVRASLQIMAAADGIPDTAAAIADGTAIMAELMASEDAAEGRSAFTQKRRPMWRNR